MRFSPSRVQRLLATPIIVLLLAAAVAYPGTVPATSTLGATPHKAGTTFRLWAPFVDDVAVKINNGKPIPMTKEAGHPQDDDTVWIVEVPEAKAGDQYLYVIRVNGVTKEFSDPRARQLIGSGASAVSVIVDRTPVMSTFKQPNFNEMVIYELHIGTFNVGKGKNLGTFTDAVAKLDYLKSLGINAVEVMPVHPNPPSKDQTPQAYNWGYGPEHLFAVNSAYGTPADFKMFIQECHDRKIAVILDVVYNHMIAGNLLDKFGGAVGPGFMNGIYFYGDARVNTPFGPRPDFGRPQVRAFIEDNVLMWLREFGVDGLRWDSTVNIRTTDKGRNPEGELLMRNANNAYRNTKPKEPGKISIAEDLQSFANVVEPTTMAGYGFNSQWDVQLWGAVRSAVRAVNDNQRDVGAIKAAIQRQIGGDAFARVINSENHDKVGHPNDDFQIRLPALIDMNDNESVFAKRRSTLAAAIILTAPGIPMLFQGQELLETRTFDFNKATFMDFDRAGKFPGILQMYKDMIALRRNQAGKTGGLTLQHVNAFHADPNNQTLAYHRFGNGGPGDDVVVVVNLSNQPQPALNIGFPRSGKWLVRFNSGAKVYDPAFVNGDSFDTTANAGQRDGLNFNANVGIGPYSVVVLSQD